MYRIQTQIVATVMAPPSKKLRRRRRWLKTRIFEACDILFSFILEFVISAEIDILQVVNLYAILGAFLLNLIIGGAMELELGVSTQCLMVPFFFYS